MFHLNGNWRDVEYTLINHSDDLPSTKIDKVHVVCTNSRGEILLVYHQEWSVWGLPGGSVEDGEEYRDTLSRECLEEANVTVKNVVPFSYYNIYQGDEVVSTALLVIAELNQADNFRVDPAGTVSKIVWCSYDDALKHIEQKPLRQRLLSDAISVLKIRYADNQT